MNKLTYKASFLLALMFAAVSNWLHGGMGFAALAIGLIFLLMGLSKLSANRTAKAIREALSQLDEVYEGLRFVGKEADLIGTFSLYAGQSRVEVEQLCRTRKGKWFTIRFENKTGTGIVYALRIEQTLSEEEAKKWLMTFDKSAYKSNFGALPEIEIA